MELNLPVKSFIDSGTKLSDANRLSRVVVASFVYLP